MSHRCGANCRRKQTPSRRSSCPTCGSGGKLPETITAGGVTRRMTIHARDKAAKGVTASHIKRVLEMCTDNSGSVTTTYWGFVAGHNSMMRVAVSLDDQRIVTAHFDSEAARRLAREGRPWFEQRCSNLEVRYAH